MRAVFMVLVLLLSLNVVSADFFLYPVSHGTSVTTGQVTRYEFHAMVNQTQKVNFRIYSNAAKITYNWGRTFVEEYHNESMTFNNYIWEFNDSFSIHNLTGNFEDAGSVDAVFYSPGTFFVYYSFSSENGTLLNGSSFNLTVTGPYMNVTGNNLSRRGLTREQIKCLDHPERCAVINYTSEKVAKPVVVNKTALLNQLKAQVDAAKAVVVIDEQKKVVEQNPVRPVQQPVQAVVPVVNPISLSNSSDVVSVVVDDTPEQDETIGERLIVVIVVLVVLFLSLFVAYILAGGWR